jgi:hypothetical protein
MLHIPFKAPAHTRVVRTVQSSIKETVCIETAWPGFIVFSGSKKQSCHVIIGKYQLLNTPSSILKIITFLRGHRWCTPAVAREAD